MVLQLQCKSEKHFIETIGRMLNIVVSCFSKGSIPEKEEDRWIFNEKEDRYEILPSLGIHFIYVRQREENTLVFEISYQYDEFGMQVYSLSHLLCYIFQHHITPAKMDRLHSR